MKIAIDIRKIGKRSTGDEVVFYHLVKELAKLAESKKHSFFLLTDQGVAKIGRILGKLPSNFEIHKVSPTAKLFWTFYSLPRFLRKNPVDVLHVEYIVPFHLSRKTKIITTIHDVSFRVNPQWIPRKDGLLLNNFIPLSLKRADGVITVSNFSKREIAKYYGYPSDRIYVTYPAVDERVFGINTNQVSKKEVNKVIGGDYPFIFHLSSLQPRKNVPLIISGFAKVKAQWLQANYPWANTKLVIVGNNKGHNYDNLINETIARLGLSKDVIMTGFLPTEILPSFYRESLVFVFPSDYEGFGIPILEAMACKTPVIASNIGSLKEVGGEAALYIDLKKSEGKVVNDLASAMQALIENKELRKGKIMLGLERVKLFNWANLAKKTLEIYENL